MPATSSQLPLAPAPRVQLVLASTSVYRRELLSRLRIPFSVAAPHVDESPLPGESAANLAQRLARAKALAVVQAQPWALALGADQTLALGEALLGKPGDHARAHAQLLQLNGREATFHSAWALVAGAQVTAALQTQLQAQLQASTNAKTAGRPEQEEHQPPTHNTGLLLEGCCDTEVRFAQLSKLELERYLHLEQPYDCAGSAKAEALGISLMERLRSDDPTAIIGLPLIGVARALRRLGISALLEEVAAPSSASSATTSTEHHHANQPGA